MNCLFSSKTNGKVKESTVLKSHFKIQSVIHFRWINSWNFHSCKIGNFKKWSIFLLLVFWGNCSENNTFVCLFLYKSKCVVQKRSSAFLKEPVKAKNGYMAKKMLKKIVCVCLCVISWTRQSKILVLIYFFSTKIFMRKKNGCFLDEKNGRRMKSFNSNL